MVKIQKSPKLKFFSNFYFNDKPLLCSANASRPVNQECELESQASPVLFDGILSFNTVPVRP